MNGMDLGQMLKLLAAPAMFMLAQVMPGGEGMGIHLKDILGIGGPLVMLSWYLFHDTTVVKPRTEKQHRDERAAMIQAASSERQGDQEKYEKLLLKLEERNDRNQAAFMTALEGLARAARCNVPQSGGA